jgi:Fe-S oxidoreductase
MFEVLDLCLECKGCKGECPANVDMAKIKYEFLAHYHAKHGLPVRSRMFANVESLNRWGSRLAPLSNWVMRSRLTKQLLEKAFGITAARIFPPFARTTLLDWFQRRKPPAEAVKRRPVVLFNDCFMTYNYPEIGRAAVELIERCGFSVVLVDKVCCGRPMISKGLVEEARKCAAHNVSVLRQHTGEKSWIVGCEPSCLLTLRDEYPDLLAGEDVKVVSRQSVMIEEFLVRLNEEKRLGLQRQSNGRKALLHGHCHQKAHIGTAPLIRCLKELGGFEVSEVDSGCCGMAGSFGFEAEHYRLSIEIGKRRLFPAVLAANPETEVIAAGVSCRQQIEHGTGRKVKHPVEVLAEALRERYPIAASSGRLHPSPVVPLRNPA